MNDGWRCGVCDGVNDGGETCAICGSSRDLAVALTPAPPAPPAQPEEQAVPDDAGWRYEPEPYAEPAPWAEPPRRRGLFGRLVEAAVDAVDRALTIPPEPPLPEEEEPERPREGRRSRLSVRPSPFGLMITWRGGHDEPEDPYVEDAYLEDPGYAEEPRYPEDRDRR